MPDASATPDREEVVRRYLTVLNQRDIGGAVAILFAPDAMYRAGGVLDFVEGRDAIRGLLEDWIGSYEDFEISSEQLSDLGNGVSLSRQLMRGRPTGSSGFVEFRYAAVAAWVDGLVERLTFYDDIDEARAAAEQLAQERG